MFLIQSFCFSPLQENTYLLYHEGGDCIIIDPGCYEAYEREQMAAFIVQHRLNPVLLLNTHCHLDHIFGNQWVYEQYQLLPHIHKNEKKVLEMAPVTGLMWGLTFDHYNGETVYLQEGDRKTMGDDVLEVLFAPGHSPGHVCFYCRQQHFIIGGDVLFKESIGRTDLPGGDHKTLLNSIRSKLFTLPGETVVYSGHGPETTISHEKKYNPFLQII